MNIHATAVIHPDAELADDVEVQPYAVIGPQVRIGAGSVVGPHAVLDGDTVIGERNRIFSGAQIGVLSQDLKHLPGLLGRVAIGNDNFIREFVTISASTRLSEDDDNVTSIGDNCMLMAYTHVAHDCHMGNSVIMANNSSLSGHVEVEDYVIFGGFAGVHQDCRVGRHAFVGGMARCVQDPPPYMIVEGQENIRCVAPNMIGLKRRGFDADALKRIKTLHKLMYRSNLNTTQALEEIERSVPESEERTVFVEFVRSSKRGIIK
jgi:UDP-N-acetylglucosamine acyltransferase